jgi:hypothetical protein
MFNVLVATLDLAVAGLIGMDIVMDVKRVRRGATN